MRKPTLRGLRGRAWSLFSRHVRSGGADFGGYAECYTCRRELPWKELQAGHYIHGKLDFSELNVHPQCARCNNWLHGNLGLYAERLIQDYGQSAVDGMRAEAATWLQPSREECLTLIERYRHKP